MDRSSHSLLNRFPSGPETGTAYHGGDVIELTGAETQAFLRLLRWAEAQGRIERLET